LAQGSLVSPLCVPSAAQRRGGRGTQRCGAQFCRLQRRERFLVMDRLDKNVVHEICTNQVVVTLHACVKELVENALDAGATRIEVRLRDSGSELLEVIDNGSGVRPENHALLATRHATSKIRQYDDLSNSLETFGFRGEALAGISAMGDMTICTRIAEESMAALLTYDRFGKLTSTAPAARETGTTVSVRELFKRLPVRHREFMRNAKAQVSATLRLIQSYAIAQPDIRFHVVAEKSRGHGAGRSTLLSTSGLMRGWLQAAAAVLGDSVVADVKPLEMTSIGGGWTVSGIISTSLGGRRSRDMQLFFVNRRPIDPPKRIVKLINDTYHQYNSRMYPVIIVSFCAAQGLVDVNVTPDKRTVFLHNEEGLLADLQQGLTEIWAPADHGSATTLGSFGIKSGAASSAAGSVVAMSSPAIADIDAGSTDHSQGGLSAQVSLLSPAGTTDRAVDEASTAEQSSPMVVDSNHSDEARSQPPAMAKCTTTFEAKTPESGHTLPRARPGDADLTLFATPEKSASDFELSRVSTQQGLTRLSSSMPMPEEPPKKKPALVMQATATVAPAPILAATQQGLDGGLDEKTITASTAARVEDGAASVCQKFAAVAASEVTPPAAATAVDCSISSVTASVSIADLEVAIARRRRTATSSAGSSAADSALGESGRVHFQSSFSLASLQAEDANKSTIEDIAKFQDGEGPPESASFRFDKSCFLQMRVIGQFNLGFIIAALRAQQGDSGFQLFIIDQHASDEKFRFEGLNRDSKIDRQPLISPHPLQLTPAQEAIASGHLDVFRKNGFDVNSDEARPPGRRLRLTSLPTCQGMVFGEKDVHDLISTLEEAEIDQGRESTQAKAASGLLDITGHRALWSSMSVPRPAKVWQLLACRACRGAIMIGKALRLGEMQRILRNLAGLQQPWNCPHGRPTMRHLVDTAVARRASMRVPPLAEHLSQGG